MGKQESSIDQGTLTFTVETRLLQELGERLVKQPEVALVELIKNAYDADATVCAVSYKAPKLIEITDDGHGMTFDEFKNGWMRIGTSSKRGSRGSRFYNRPVTGEKGIGRFAVRFLGTMLELQTVADDPKHGFRTTLEAVFDWPALDHIGELQKVQVPYVVRRATKNDLIGTKLRITRLRAATEAADLNAVRSASITVVSPFRALIFSEDEVKKRRLKPGDDPGFTLTIDPAPSRSEDSNVAKVVLENAVLRAAVKLRGDRVSIDIFKKGSTDPELSINDTYKNTIGDMDADIRFFPRRKGTFAGMPIKGPIAKKWIENNSGVAVFDRNFRVLPYGAQNDDWLWLSADAARRAREPRSKIARKHFPMDDATKVSTQLNYMLRLPYPKQLVGLVRVQGRRSSDGSNDEGLIAAADREGFVDNLAFKQLRDIVRGAIEAIASVDREIQLEEEEEAKAETLRKLREETRAAIHEIEANPNIRATDKARIVKRLATTGAQAEEYEVRAKEQEARLEVMSLLGIVSGFMTHEFGVALHELQQSRDRLIKLAKRDSALRQHAESLDESISSLEEFVKYSKGYIRAGASSPDKSYEALPRVKQTIRVFGKYAQERGIDVRTEISSLLPAPRVPVSLYSGVLLNLYTNALKAVMTKAGPGEKIITFAAENEDGMHYLRVSDTGIGIPEALKTRVFDPLFTTTAGNRDPLGSGLGLGLTLVRRGVETFGGRVALIEPPPEYTTCVQVKLPLGGH
jgi:signal transduction histidine kinase